MSKMSKLFDQDNMFFAIMGVLFDLIILNVLTLLCCLPVVTAGASFTAMHSVLWRMVRHEETYVTRQFFDSFKRNLKQSLLPWLAFLLAAIVLVVDGMLARSMGSMRGPLMACVVFMGLVIIAIAQYFFPLLSRYENPTSETLKNATKLALGFFPAHLVHAGDFGRVRRAVCAVFHIYDSAADFDGRHVAAILLRVDLQLDFPPYRR